MRIGAYHGAYDNRKFTARRCIVPHGHQTGSLLLGHRGTDKLYTIAPTAAKRSSSWEHGFGKALLFLDTPSPVSAQTIERTTIASIPKTLIC
jgi:hypothetical protein